MIIEIFYMLSFPLEETTFLLPGPAGDLEVLATPVAENPKNNVAIICHPHPLFGGTMTNKVVSTIARALKDLNIPTVRFNFRGVGKSAGSFAEGVGELEDLKAVIAWVKKVCPDKEVWLAGFSFGGFIAAKAATEIPVAQLVTVSPQASRFVEEKNFPEILVSWLMVQGEQDDVVSPQELYDWIATLKHKPVLIKIAAGHFYHGKLLELREKLVAALSSA